MPSLLFAKQEPKGRQVRNTRGDRSPSPALPPKIGVVIEVNDYEFVIAATAQSKGSLRRLPAHSDD
jgi:hypothetical protein